MEDEEAADLGPRHLWIVRQMSIHTSNFPLDEIVDLWPSCEISIARVGQSTALGPVTYRPEVDVDESLLKGRSWPYTTASLMNGLNLSLFSR